MLRKLFLKKTKYFSYEKTPIRYLIIVSGKVQGVGFRFFTFTTAKLLNLTGWVRNCDNGTVKLEAQGSKNNITKLLHKLKSGNGLSKTESLSIKEISPISNDSDFNILN